MKYPVLYIKSVQSDTRSKRGPILQIPKSWYSQPANTSWVRGGPNSTLPYLILRPTSQ